MRKLIISAFCLVSLTASAQHITNQYQNILDEKTYDIIVAEASGEKTKNIAADVASYEVSERDFNNLKESDYFIKKLNEFGLEDVKLNRFPGAKAWIASKAVLFEVSPKYAKIADYSDLPASVCAGSVDTNVESAQLVWVGMATESELRDLDLTGKIAFGEANPSALHEACVAKGAIGVVSCYGRDFNEIQIPNISLRSKNPTFAFLITRREGYALRDRLRRGETIMVSCEIKSENVEFEYQSPSCVIKGTNPELGEVILSAHLFEGYAKLGANDNMSGSAVLLDVARTLNVLIEEGKIDRPLRSIRFIWGDEFVGIIPWTKANKDVLDNTLFNLNLDMVGVDLTDHQTTYVLHRNRFASSHYSGDLAETLMNYIHTTNVKSIILGEFIKPVIAPSGSNDPFHYNTTPYYWAS
ncbi:MAG: M28 family peptidase, partial [Rikenellaceae bacterium]